VVKFVSRNEQISRLGGNNSTVRYLTRLSRDYTPTNGVINEHKKLSCRRETARRFVSLNILLSHSRSFEITLLRRACVSRY